MLGNRGRDTKPELAVRRAVHALGLRYYVSWRPLPGRRVTADLLFPRVRVAVFVDGCFWHGCPEHYSASMTNVEYWAAKIQRNQARDRDTDERLDAAGWVVIRAWEHDDPTVTAHRVATAVLSRR
jgi:DNA mismatch endonuclease (patch repair protein)